MKATHAQGTVILAKLCEDDSKGNQEHAVLCIVFHPVFHEVVSLLREFRLLVSVGVFMYRLCCGVAISFFGSCVRLLSVVESSRRGLLCRLLYDSWGQHREKVFCPQQSVMYCFYHHSWSFLGLNCPSCVENLCLYTNFPWTTGYALLGPSLSPPRLSFAESESSNSPVQTLAAE